MRKTLLIICILNIFQVNAKVIYDPVVNASILKQTAEEIKQWKEKLKQYEEEVKIYKEQLNSLAGKKDVLSILDATENLTNSFSGILKDIKNSSNLLEEGFGVLDENSRDIFKRHGIGKRCELMAQIQQKLCEGSILYEIGNLTEQERFVAEVEKTVNKLIALANEINQSQDIKQSADYANQITALVGVLQAQKIQNDLRIQNEERMQKLIEQKRDENFVKINSRYDPSGKDNSNNIRTRDKNEW